MMIFIANDTFKCFFSPWRISKIIIGVPWQNWQNQAIFSRNMSFKVLRLVFIWLGEGNWYCYHFIRKQNSHYILNVERDLAEWIKEWKFLQAGATPSQSPTAALTVWLLCGQNRSLWDGNGSELLNKESEDNQSWNRSQK